MKTIEFEGTNCGYCGSDKCTVLYSAPEHSEYTNCKIVKCNQCDLVRTNPRPTLSTLYDTYTNDYYSREVPHSEKISDKLKIFALKNKLKILYPFIIPYSFSAENVRICDVGCGAGQWLKLVREAYPNAQLYGFEIDLPTANTVAKGTGATVHNGDFLNNNWPSNHFDFITFWDVLEHIHNPREVLLEVERLLKPGGYAIISLPNFDSFHSKIFKQFWFSLAYDAHLYHFTQETLKELLKTSLLTPIYTTTNTFMNPVLSFSIQIFINEMKFHGHRKISADALSILCKIISLIDRSQLSRLFSDHLVIHAQKSSSPQTSTQ
jgi:2-polyprenyl-3-methyl-5-hydroxy-6-metoxy-1,4-benzoquinol methylase